ncbi:hypothetical protein [Chamaesiphon sp. OTE_20_metabat_361]|uniref:hypothetical protein n=1 Tax=Chamaesiphon sp. OTE_20_metabat_361 TaxID=2964689 RepID=UPI00286C7212|nr:hypothetical protein [Chamaesiphon sp. OTE_20_metabat_361]
MTKKALLDACTIFGMPIKDTLFTAAFQGVFQLYLSEEILKDFPVRSYQDYNLSVLHPDNFLLDLCDYCGDEALINVLEEQSHSLKKTSISPLQILDKLRINRCNKFADRLCRAIGDRF